MKTRTKALLMSLCAMLLIVGSVMGTMAYLTSEDHVENTFTVGHVKVTLDEAKVDEAGHEILPKSRVHENSYKLIPGHEYIKDPAVHLDPDSEPCYLYVVVKNELKREIDNEVVDATVPFGDNQTIQGYPVIAGWDVFAGPEVTADGTTTIYVREVKKPAEENEFDVLDGFKVNPELDNETLAAFEGSTIQVTAYAFQKDGFATAQEAWNACLTGD